MTTYLVIAETLYSTNPVALQVNGKSKFDVYKKMKDKYRLYYIFSPTEYNKANVEKLAKKHGWW